jgi:hypothetical protein
MPACLSGGSKAIFETTKLIYNESVHYDKLSERFVLKELAGNSGQFKTF